MAKENIDVLKGTINFSSQEKKGSVFTITLPYKPIDKEVLTTIKKEDTVKQEINGTKKSTILIAEDVIVNYRLLEIMLGRINGFNIIHAKNGQEAVDICKENNAIDLVFMDIRMPILDGYEATKEIKKAKPTLPIIVQTAYTAFADIDKAFQAGCDDFMPKPIEKEILHKIINKYLF